MPDFIQCRIHNNNTNQSFLHFFLFSLFILFFSFLGLFIISSKIPEHHDSRKVLLSHVYFDPPTIRPYWYLERIH